MNAVVTRLSITDHVERGGVAALQRVCKQRTVVTSHVLPLAVKVVRHYAYEVQIPAISSNSNNNINKRSESFDENAASPPHMDGSIVFARWGQCAPHASVETSEPTSKTVS